MHRILGSFQKEFFFIYFPGLLGIVLAILLPELGETSLIYGLLATALIDSGHVYTTFWRTFFYPKEMKTHPRYWIAPLLVFLLLGLAFYLEFVWFWKFVVYATLFHHLRQVYGISRWYQALNGRQDKRSDTFLYALSILPMLIYHLRSGAHANYYSQTDLFFFSHETLKHFLLLIEMGVFIAWVIYERRLYLKGIVEINRMLSVGYPALMYGYCFLAGVTTTQVLFPLLFMHGIAYIALMAQTVHRTRQNLFTSFSTALGILVMTALILGLNEAWFETHVLNFQLEGTTLSQSILIGLYLTPLFCHYIFDAWIWKKSHHESAIFL